MEAENLCLSIGEINSLYSFDAHKETIKELVHFSQSPHKEKEVLAFFSCNYFRYQLIKKFYFTLPSLVTSRSNFFMNKVKS